MLASFSSENKKATVPLRVVAFAAYWLSVALRTRTMFEDNSNHAEANRDLRHGCSAITAAGQGLHGG
jgi:hypothetical protein